MRGDEERGEEREQKVGREARENLHDRLRVAGEPRRHADLHADRHPNQRRHDHHDRNTEQRERPEAEGVRELAETRVVADVTQR